MNIFLGKQIIVKKGMSANGIVAYMALRKIMDSNILLKSKEDTAVCVSANALSFSLVGVNTVDKQFISALWIGIEELVEAGVISIVLDLSTKYSNEAIIDLENLYFDSKNDEFIIVSDDEIKKILLLDEAVKRKISMVRYFSVLISTMDWSLNVLKRYRGKVNHMPQSYIAELADISEKTMQRYNDVLVTAHIIYVYKSNDKIKYKSTNTLKQINNCYSRYLDWELCEKYARDFEEEQGAAHKLVRTKKKKEQADRNRQLAQIYNRIAAEHTDTYDKDTICDVYRYVFNKNKALQKEIDYLLGQKYLSERSREYLERLQSQVRDMERFNQFSFLNSDDDQWGESDPLELDFEVETVEPEVSESDEWIFDL